MYADDTEIHYVNKDLPVVEKQMQEDICSLESWMASNKLRFNVKKSSVMLIGTHQRLREKSISVSMYGSQLDQVSTTTHLGLINYRQPV